uniref:Reverse transcriptase/retrotransposon-derived protein RNase H-like domain-containing protein n=1 Tax=Ananas comosus var. bracteatus TaxID=296719 RepID=A0A6V7NXZ3_ANACO|nr:unnamed protein product [Ananas comosus var. bracteatus]
MLGEVYEQLGLGVPQIVVTADAEGKFVGYVDLQISRRETVVQTVRCSSSQFPVATDAEQETARLAMKRLKEECDLRFKDINCDDSLLYKKRTIQTLEDILKVCVLDFGGGWHRHLRLAEFAYNSSYQTSIQMALFEALYGRRCRSPLFWSNVGERKTLGPKILLEAEKRIALPRRLVGIHDVFHISVLRRYVFDTPHVIDFTPPELSEDLRYEEQPVRILAQETKNCATEPFLM